MECKIKLNEKNVEKIEEILAKVQERCKAQLLDASEILKEGTSFIGHLKEHGVLNKNLSNCVYKIGYRDFPRAYKFIPVGTVATIMMIKNDAYLVEVKRDNCKGHNEVVLTKEAIADVLSFAINSASLTVKKHSCYLNNEDEEHLYNVF